MSDISKPGVKTTEFWVTLISSLSGPIVAILVAAGAFHSGVSPDEFASKFNPAIQALVDNTVVIIGLITGAVATGTYTKQRTAAKTFAASAANK